MMPPNSLQSPWCLADDVTFLNHGSFGACPRAVLQHQTALRDKLEAQPVHFFRRELEDQLAAALTPMAQLLDCPTANLAFIPNATSGINGILQSFPWPEKGRIAFLNHEYNATVMAIKATARYRNLALTEISLPAKITAASDIVAAISEQMPQDTTMLVFDAITSPSAICLPSAEIVAICNDRGIATLIDGAHVPGQIPFSLTKIAPSFFVGNCHKWLCTPKGSAVIFASSPYLESIHPAVVSHGYGSERTTLSRFHEQFFWPGTYDPTALLAIPYTIEWLNKHDPQGLTGIMAANHSNIARARSQLESQLGWQPIVPLELNASMCAFDVTDAYPKNLRMHGSGVDLPLQSYLWLEHKIEIPEMILDGRKLLRISWYTYNQQQDIDNLVDAIKSLARPS